MLMNDYLWLWIGTAWMMHMAVVLFGAAMYGIGFLIEWRQKKR